MPEKRITVYVLGGSDRPFPRLEWVDPETGLRRSRSARTSEGGEVEQARADLEYELNHGLHARARAGPRLGWEAFTKLYLEEKLAPRRKRTREQAAHVFSEFATLSGVKLLCEVDARAVSRYASGLRKKERAEATVAGYLAYLKAGLRWALDQELISRVPKIQMPKLPRRLRIRTVSPAEFGFLLGHCPDEIWRGMLHCAWHTGMRRNELITLTWSEEAPEAGAEPGPWLDMQSKRVWFPVGSAKAEREDWVPVHDDLHALLAPHARGSGKVFPAAPVYEGLAVHAKEVSKHFRKIADSAGLPDVTLHDLRRTFGSRYAKVVPAQILQRLMRHADIKTTLKYYADLDDGLGQAINTL